MKVYERLIDIKKKDDGKYTISVAIGDSTLIVRTITKAQLHQLKSELTELLKD